MEVTRRAGGVESVGKQSQTARDALEGTFTPPHLVLTFSLYLLSIPSEYDCIGHRIAQHSTHASITDWPAGHSAAYRRVEVCVNMRFIPHLGLIKSFML